MSFAATAQAPRSSSAIAPYLWLAGVAFVLGFVLGLSVSIGRLASDRLDLRGPVEAAPASTTIVLPNEPLKRI